MAVYIPIVSEFNSKGIDKAMKEFKSLEGAGKKLQFAIKKAAVPATAALAALAAGAFDAVKAGSDLAEAQSKVGVIFEDGAKSVEKFAKTAARSLGQSKQQVLDAAGTFGTFGKAAGLGGKDLAKFSTRFTSLASDLASFNNTSPQEAIDALGAALRGEAEPMRRFGVLLNDAALKAEAMKLGIYDGSGALTDQQKILAAQSAIYKQTSDAQGDFARTSGGMANSSKILTAQIQDLKTSIGSALLPVVEKVLPFLKTMATWAADNPQTFMIIAGALAAISASIVAINIAMALNPIGLITIGVIALVAGLAIAYKKFEGFRNIVDAVFGAIKFYINNVTIPLIKTLVNVFKTVFNGIATVWNNTIGKLSFKVPSWVPGLGGKGFSVPSIPMLAEGGIVNTPGGMLAMIGEKGPEAVIPLDRMGQMGGGTTVNINVNGGDPNAVVQALRTYMRQNGSVPIKISNAF